VVTILLLILAIAGFSVFSFGNVERTIASLFPKLTGGQVRWTGLVVGFLAAAAINSIVALVACGVAIYFKVRR
jgi:hypothetical protein